MNTQETLTKARQVAALAAAKVAELEKQAEFEASFGQTLTGYMVVRRCIDTGRVEKQHGVFMDSAEASRFALGVAGYGVGKDVFVETIDIYPAT